MPPDELEELLRERASLADRFPRGEDLAAARRRLKTSTPRRARDGDDGGDGGDRPDGATPASSPWSRLPRGVPASASAEQAASSSPPRQPPRVGIITSDFPGPVKNGGIGTAYHALARALAGAGHAVTVLYTGSTAESGTPATWRELHRAHGIELEVPAPDPVPVEGPWHLQASYRAYLWARTRDLDVLHYPDMFGSGFHVSQAKRLGLALGATTLVAGLHGPTVWHRVENGEPLDRTDLLLLDFMERESIARADVLVAPSRYLLGWVRDWGFRLPPRVHVEPYVSPRPPARAAGVSAGGPHSRRTISEVVFFGRLETRKGLELFCDAIGMLAAPGRRVGANDSRSSVAGLDRLRVTFLGKAGRVVDGGEDGAAYVQRRALAWPFPVRIETALDKDQAMAYLAAHDAVAVVPSLADNTPNTVLECLAASVPLLAARAGGIPEMLAGGAHGASALFAPRPEALAERIAQALEQGAAPSQPADDPEDVRRASIAWHESLVPAAHGGNHVQVAREAPGAQDGAGSEPDPGARPLVSVCMATRDRPAPLARALASVAAQTYAPLEVVLVDDASDEPATLDALAPDLARRGWRLVRSRERLFPGAARNLAAAHARGEYLLFMDDDNLARPEEVATLVRASLHARIPLLTCAFDTFHGDPPPSGEPAVDFRWLPVGAAVPLGLFENRLGDTNLLVRRDVFLALGGFEEERGVGLIEDWILLSRAALAGIAMAAVPEPLFLYRRPDEGHGPPPDADLHHVRRLRPYLEGASPEEKALVLYASGLDRRLRALESGRGPEAAARVEALRSRFEEAHAVLALGPGDAALLVAERDLTIAGGEAAGYAGILLRATGRDPIAWLPGRLPARGSALVRLELTVSVPTVVQLFWTTRRPGAEPSEDQSVVLEVDRGRSVRYAELPAAARGGRLRLDPAMAPGNVLLHALEVRAEEAPSLAERAHALATRLLLPVARLLRRSG